MKAFTLLELTIVVAVAGIVAAVAFSAAQSAGQSQQQVLTGELLADEMRAQRAAFVNDGTAAMLIVSSATSARVEFHWLGGPCALAGTTAAPVERVIAATSTSAA
ncbi:MAG: prepilin-type N-terminal cleavage/methylation domain-containing protein [Deltaproteobacteria bacterium]|nr:prepilin-type N-terminal cleavage/methylation domain-containing protein [Deltaproteobacteria bacterium]